MKLKPPCSVSVKKLLQSHWKRWGKTGKVEDLEDEKSLFSVFGLFQPLVVDNRTRNHTEKSNLFQTYLTIENNTKKMPSSCSVITHLDFFYFFLFEAIKARIKLNKTNKKLQRWGHRLTKMKYSLIVIKKIPDSFPVFQFTQQRVWNVFKRPIPPIFILWNKIFKCIF